MGYSNKTSLVGESIVAAVVVVGLYALSMSARFAPLQIPGYLLIVGFDMLEAAFGPVESNYYVLFYIYLLILGVIGAVVVHSIRKLSLRRDRSIWRLGVSGALTVIGTLSLLFALSAFFGTSQTDPVIITGVTGIVLFAAAGWISGVLDTSWR